MRLFSKLADIIYYIRNILWNYPDTLFFGDLSLVGHIRSWYNKTRPFSHFALSSVIFILLVSILTVNTNALLGINTNIYIEGVVVGLDENTGTLKGVERINPLIPSNTQIEKDIGSLIYEELLRVNQNGEVEMVLLESFGEIKPGNSYRFKLRGDVYWHDGEKMTTEDVAETMNLLKRLQRSTETASNFSNVVTNQLDDIRIIDNHTFELKLKSEDAVLPTILEAISFKILPAKYIKELNDISVFSHDIQLNKYPVGTGGFRFESSTRNSITLIRNDKYHGEMPRLKKIRFRLFPDEESAYSALATFNIHALGGISTDILNRSANLTNYHIFTSNVIYNRYWALYFNLNENGGLPMLQSQNVRKAINLAVNKEEIIGSISGMGEVAYGTIPRNSFAFADELAWPEYNKESAIQLLAQDGWEMNTSTGIIEKDRVPLSFELILVDNPDRVRIAEVIQENLKEVGIEVNLKIEPLNVVVDKYILPKQFDSLLYGQTTFIDPDRYELFHSSQRGNVLLDGASGTENTGLNISGFKSLLQDSRIIDKELVKVAKADTLLEDGRQFLDKERRIDIYRQLQEILADEVPVVFLYNPIYPYIVNQRVKNVDINSIVHIEDRFRSISKWEIEL
jgi:peptide/nickel transport system substrate-binding protein